MNFPPHQITKKYVRSWKKHPDKANSRKHNLSLKCSRTHEQKMAALKPFAFWRKPKKTSSVIICLHNASNIAQFLKKIRPKWAKKSRLLVSKAGESESPKKISVQLFSSFQQIGQNVLAIANKLRQRKTDQEWSCLHCNFSGQRCSFHRCSDRTYSATSLIQNVFWPFHFVRIWIK